MSGRGAVNAVIPDVVEITPIGVYKLVQVDGDREHV
jgi:hypothetical protein